jgi:hypothetical protein
MVGWPELDVDGDKARFKELGVWGLERDGPDDGESGCQLALRQRGRKAAKETWKKAVDLEGVIVIARRGILVGRHTR